MDDKKTDGRVLLETKIPGKKLFKRGKVRDSYWIPGWRRTDQKASLLQITTDRLSVFDCVFPNGVPGLGKIRNMISLFWFDLLSDLCRNHIITADQEICSHTIRRGCREENDLVGRSVLVHCYEPLPVECIARGYLSGSAWTEYQEKGQCYGIKLPSGMEESQQLESPIFIPTTKAKSGHDKPLTFLDLANLVGLKTAEMIRDKTLLIYNEAFKWAIQKTIIIADTKLEFALDEEGELVLIDELLTPDSSRFWDACTYVPGIPQLSFDKQPVRDWAEETGWDKQPPAPPLPEHVVQQTQQRYAKAYERLTSNAWPVC